MARRRGGVVGLKGELETPAVIVRLVVCRRVPFNWIYQRFQSDMSHCLLVDRRYTEYWKFGLLSLLSSDNRSADMLKDRPLRCGFVITRLRRGAAPKFLGGPYNTIPLPPTHLPFPSFYLLFSSPPLLPSLRSKCLKYRQGLRERCKLPCWVWGASAESTFDAF